MKKYFITTLSAKEILRQISLRGADEPVTLDFSRELTRLPFINKSEYQSGNAVFDQITKLQIHKDSSAKYNPFELSEILFKLNFDGVKANIKAGDFEKLLDSEDKRSRFSEAAKAWKLYREGFYIKFSDERTEHFECFEHGASMVRNAMDYFVRSDVKSGVEPRLMLEPYLKLRNYEFNPAKYYAYRGLYLTDGVRIEALNGKKLLNKDSFIVIDDCKEGYFETDENENVINAPFKVLTGVQVKDNRLKMKCESKQLNINLFDGQGIISPDFAEIINAALQDNGIQGENDFASSFQFRMPFGKGMLHKVDFKKFFRDELNEEPDGLYIKDCFGIKRNLGKAQIILVKSQFKFADAMKELKEKDPMEAYFKGFYEYDHAMYIKATDLAYASENARVRFAYQLINALPELDSDTFRKLVNENIDPLFKTDEAGEYRVNLEETDGMELKNIAGALVNFKNGNKGAAIKLNPYFLKEKEVIDEIRSYKRAKLTQLANGNFEIDGVSKYIVRDLLYFLIFIARKAVRKTDEKSLYKTVGERIDTKNATIDRESFWAPSEGVFKGGKYYAFFRFPCYSKYEPALLKCSAGNRNKDGENLYEKYFSHLKGCVFIARSSISITQLGGADQDGDRCLISLNQDINSAVKKFGYGKNNQRLKPIIAIPSIGGSKKVSMQGENGLTKESLAACLEALFNGFNSSIGRLTNLGVTLIKAAEKRNEQDGMKAYVNKKKNQNKLIADRYNDEYIGVNEYIENNITETAAGEDCGEFDIGAYSTIVGGVEIDAAKTSFRPNTRFMFPKKPRRASFFSYTGRYDGKIRHFDFHQTYKTKRAPENGGLGVFKILKKVSDSEKPDEEVFSVCDYDTAVANIDNLPSFFAEHLERVQKDRLNPSGKENVRLFKFEEDENWRSCAETEKGRALAQLVKDYKDYKDFTKKFNDAETENNESTKEINRLLVKKYDSLYSPLGSCGLSVVDAYDIAEQYLSSVEVQESTFKSLIDKGWEFSGDSEELKTEILDEITRKSFEKAYEKEKAAIRAILFNFIYDGYRMLPYILINLYKKQKKREAVRELYNTEGDSPELAEMKRCFLRHRGFAVKVEADVIEGVNAIASGAYNNDALTDDGDEASANPESTLEREIISVCRNRVAQIFKNGNSFDSGEAIKHCRAIKANAFFWDVFSREEIEKAVCRYPEISKKEER